MSTILREYFHPECGSLSGVGMPGQLNLELLFKVRLLIIDIICIVRS